MSQELRARLFAELDRHVLIDPHTHINPHAAASTTLADVLGYHYYTELAHSAGMPRERIEEPGLDPKEKVGRLAEYLPAISNTVQYSWLIEMADALLGWDGSDVGPDNWERLYDAAADRMAAPDWATSVLRKSGLESVFLTNDFDDPLTGFDSEVYIPCLRTDDLVFHLAKPEVRSRQAAATGVEAASAADLRTAIGKLFAHFTSRGARACAISLPPTFAPEPIDEAAADAALQVVLRFGPEADEAAVRALSHFTFWTLAEHCREYGLPFDLMIGVNRGRLRGRRLSGPRPLRLPRLADSVSAAVQRVSGGCVPHLRVGERHQPGACQLRLDLPQRGHARALVVFQHPEHD